MNIIEAIEDKRFFRPLFKDLSTWHSWLIFLKALFGLQIEERKDRKLFRQCTGLKRPSNKPARETYCIVGRRGGKSFISATISVYLATFKDWSKYLSPGERGYIFIVAVDKKQAAIIKGYISGILHSNKYFERMVARETSECIDLINNISIMIKTASYRSIRGYTILCAIFEELSFWRDEQSANPDKEIVNAVLPALSTIPDSLLLGISTPYSRSGLLWEQYHTHFGSNEREAPLIWKASTRVMHPTIDKRIIDDALSKDYSAAKSEWLADFREDIMAFLSLEMIEQAVIPGRIELLRIEGVRYFGFVDPSGGRADSMTLAIAHKDENTNKIVLDLVREARPPFVPKEVVKDFSMTLKNYGISLIESDHYAAEWVSSNFREHEIMVENATSSTSEIYLSFLPQLSNQNIELLDNKRVILQLRGLERKTRPGGKDQVTHYPGGHDDLANAASAVCVYANMMEENDGEILINLIDQEDKDFFSMEDDIQDMQRRMTAYLLGCDYKPPR